MKNKIDDLRNHLFASLERLSNEDLDEDELNKEVLRSASIVQVSETIINTAKVEVDFIKATNPNSSTGFFPEVGEGKLLETVKKKN